MSALDKFAKQFNKATQKKGDQWLEKIPAWTGDYAGVVDTGTSGFMFVRVDAQVVEVFNGVAPLEPNIPITIGRHKDQPQLWQVIGKREVWSAPASPNTLHHHEQHEFMQSDMIALDRKQITTMNVLVTDGPNFVVQVYGGIIRTGDTYVKIDNQTFDLSPYVVSVGAAFVNIEADESGVLAANVGDNFEAQALASATEIPIPTGGNVLIATVLMYESQEELSDSEILIPWTVERGGVGAQIFSAINKSSLDDDDRIGVWDSVTGRLRSVLWSTLSAIILALTNALYATISHTHEEYLNDAGHVHGLARWNGGTGQTTFEFPDYVEYIQSVTLAGSLVDPATYSLSSDRSQLVLDSALGSDGTITSQYVIAGV